MRNRKFIVFSIAIIALVLLDFFDKSNAMPYIQNITMALFAANVCQKNEHFQIKNNGEL